MDSRCGPDKQVTNAQECYEKLVTNVDGCSDTFTWSSGNGGACYCISNVAPDYDTWDDALATSYYAVPTGIFSITLEKV